MKHLVRRYFKVINYLLKIKHILNLIDTYIIDVSTMNIKIQMIIFRKKV